MYGSPIHFSETQTPNVIMKSYVYDIWTSRTIPQLNYCASLPQNCDEARVDSSGRILCTKCKSTFFNLDFNCVQGCPEGN